jgi:uncharacterized protein (TIRG00374 family)
MEQEAISLYNREQTGWGSSLGTSLRKIAFLVLRFAIGIAMLVWLHRTSALSFHPFARIVQIWPLTLVAVAILFLDLFFMAIRVSLLFRVQKLSLSFWNAMQLTLIGFLFSMVLPGTAGGEIAKFYYAGRENQGKRAEIAAALLFDRLIGLLSMLLLPLLLAPFFSQLIRSVAAIKRILLTDALLAVSLLMGIIAVMSYEGLRNLISGWLRKWLSVQNLWNRVTQALISYRGERAALIYALLLSLIANFAFIVVTALGLFATSPDSFSAKLFFMAPIGYFINALPLTPGGLGVGEAAFNALFALAGMTGGADTLLCVRLWSAIVGLAGVAVYLCGMGRIVHWDHTIASNEVKEYLAVESAGDSELGRG